MKKQYEPITPGQKVAYLIEECGEVLQAVGKLQRWGAHSTNPELRAGDEGHGVTNVQWLESELLDLQIAVLKVQLIIADGSLGYAELEKR